MSLKDCWQHASNMVLRGGGQSKVLQSWLPHWLSCHSWWSSKGCLCHQCEFTFVGSNQFDTKGIINSFRVIDYVYLHSKFRIRSIIWLKLICFRVWKSSVFRNIPIYISVAIFRLGHRCSLQSCQLAMCTFEKNALVRSIFWSRCIHDPEFI